MLQYKMANDKSKIDVSFKRKSSLKINKLKNNGIHLQKQANLTHFVAD